MRGLLSNAPAPGAIRLLVGTHLMLIVQSILVLRAAAVPLMLRLIVITTCLVALVGFALAVLGERRDDGRGAREWWRRRHGW